MKIVLSKILNNFRETYVLTVYFGRKDILRMTNYCQGRYIDEVSKKIINAVLIILWLALTHFMPLFLSTPPLSKRPENWRFSVVFRGYRKRPTVWNGLKLTLPNADLKFWG